MLNNFLVVVGWWRAVPDALELRLILLMSSGEVSWTPLCDIGLLFIYDVSVAWNKKS
jgi:hypothetical protein